MISVIYVVVISSKISRTDNFSQNNQENMQELSFIWNITLRVTKAMLIRYWNSLEIYYRNALKKILIYKSTANDFVFGIYYKLY